MNTNKNRKGENYVREPCGRRVERSKHESGTLVGQLRGSLVDKGDKQRQLDRNTYRAGSDTTESSG